MGVRTHRGLEARVRECYKVNKNDSDRLLGPEWEMTDLRMDDQASRAHRHGVNPRRGTI